MQPDTPWTSLPDDLTDRFERRLLGYTLTISRALYRWSWRIEHGGVFVDQSEPLFNDPAAAMVAAEEVAGLWWDAKRLEGR